jgi:formate/nitrite transporter
MTEDDESLFQELRYYFVYSSSQSFYFPHFKRFKLSTLSFPPSIILEASQGAMSSAPSPKSHAPPNSPISIDSHTPVETLHLAELAGIAKAHLSWTDLIIKSFIAGIFISIGAGFDLLIASGATSLRATNPSLATLISGLTFPVGFVFIMLTNMELCTSNMFVMPYAVLRRRISIYDCARNVVVSYIGNLAGCLFYAGFLFYWADVLTTEAETAYAITQAEARVDINWGYNVSRGIMCNWLVSLAFFFASQGRDNTSKIIGIWVSVATFAVMGYQHSIANFFSVPAGMFYGTSFGVGKFIWASVIPVTIGNVIGGTFFGSFVMWMVYGRHEPLVRETQDDGTASKV